jgi:hypothetical protein
MRMDVGQRHAGLAVAEQANRPQRGMLRAKAQKLRADKSGGAKDGYINHREYMRQ